MIKKQLKILRTKKRVFFIIIRMLAKYEADDLKENREFQNKLKQFKNKFKRSQIRSELM